MEKEFKQHVLRVSSTLGDKLPKLLNEFGQIINSNRRLSTVTSFEELIVLLIKRDFIDPADKCSWVKLNEAFHKYGLDPFDCEPAFVGFHNMQQIPTALTSQQVHLVSSFLSVHLMYSWRNFARGLNIPANTIATIEEKYSEKPSVCVEEVLKAYSRMPWVSVSNGNLIQDILVSLEIMNRKHLQEDFKKLVLMKGIGRPNKYA